jgi:hypothetical protein
VLGDRRRFGEGRLTRFQRGPELTRVLGEQKARPVIEEPCRDVRRSSGLAVAGRRGLVAAGDVFGRAL